MIESDVLVVLFIVFGIFLLVAAMLGYLAGMSSNQRTPWGLEPYGDDEDDEYEEEGTDQEVQDLAPPEMGPIPIDPQNPPKNVVFYPKDPARDPATYPVCNCHGEPIKAGAEMVQWPQPNDAGMLLFHADWLRDQGMSPAGVR